MIQKVWRHLKRYNPYSIYAAKSELKSEVSASYLTWIWWIPRSGALHARLCIHHGRGVPLTGRVSAGGGHHRLDDMEFFQ